VLAGLQALSVAGVQYRKHLGKHHQNPNVTRIIITTLGNRETVIKLEKQLTKIIDVLEVKDLTHVYAASREMILVRMKITDANQGKILQAIDTLKWKNCKNGRRDLHYGNNGGKEEIDNALALLENWVWMILRERESIAIERQKKSRNKSYKRVHAKCF